MWSPVTGRPAYVVYAGFLSCYYGTSRLWFLDECRYEFWGSYRLKLNIWRMWSVWKNLCQLQRVQLWACGTGSFTSGFSTMPDTTNADNMISTTFFWERPYSAYVLFPPLFIGKLWKSFKINASRLFLWTFFGFFEAS